VTKPLWTACLIAALAGAAHAQEIDTVRVGSAGLRGARLPTGADTVDSYVLEEGVRRPTSTTVRTVTRSWDGPDSAYVIETLHWAPGADTSATTMTIRASDLSLVHHRVKASHDSAAVTASRTHLTAWVVLPDTPVRLIDRALDHPVFGVDGQIPWLLPLLPLAEGYRAAIPRFSQWEGGEVWGAIEVLRSERVTLGARGFDCWRVDTGPLGPPGYRMLRWIEKDSRRVVQSALRGGAGQKEYWSYLRMPND
jgi:hypothetical protein